jgi:hypothetical protein
VSPIRRTLGPVRAERVAWASVHKCPPRLSKVSLGRCGGRALSETYERWSITKRPKLVQPGEAHAMIAPGWFQRPAGAKHGSN